MNRAPSDPELLADFLVGGTTGEASSNIELPAGQMAAGFFRSRNPLSFGT